MKICRWNPRRYRQQLDLHQPTAEALQLLATLDGLLINYVEVTREWVLADEAQKANWLKLFQHGFRQPWHGKMQGQQDDEGATTRRTPPDEPRRGHWYHWYSDHASKLTGELPCFRFEGRHEGAQAVRSIGIHTPHDLLAFDFDSYFAKHIRLYETDLARLGRYHHNQVHRAKRKRNRDRDRLLGRTIYRIHSWAGDGSLRRSLQQFLDNYPGRRPYLRKRPLHIYVHVRE